MAHLECSVCGKKFELSYLTEGHYVCDVDEANLNFIHDYEAIAKDVRENGLNREQKNNMFRYSAFLPVDSSKLAERAPAVPVGGTPLVSAPRLAKELGIPSCNLWLKDDSKNPTGSLKDRASSLLVVRMQEDGAPVITTASTGNAGAALAGMCASTPVRQKAYIFVPKTAPAAKIAQLQIFGAEVILVDGTYDDAFALCLEASSKHGWYCRNTGYNAYTAEGKKTVSLEMCEQLAHGGQFGCVHHAQFVAPDYVAVSVGDGNIITGVYKGLRDLYKAGLIEKMPKLVGVNSDKSNWCATAWKKNLTPAEMLTMEPVEANTRADSISAGIARDGINAVQAIRDTQGCFVEVDDDSILAHIKTVSQATGVFPEPAAACAAAGITKLASKGYFEGGSTVVAVMTGTGIKDIPAAVSVCGEPFVLKRREDGQFHLEDFMQ
ncbi:Threonine synthase [Carpediemonas membranifera]|uniref:Threonine synthase n=1 Tax=Carpediemonas membranifera TaxID=201153 RepID=A0A8J6E9I9_9EUKA|nr:Threonine synthase [Carpediemonas membranifera]|eukprot:KAG9393415.1 Threonine synthase [Carpediemonas membranifera]